MQLGLQCRSTKLVSVCAPTLASLFCSLAAIRSAVSAALPFSRSWSSGAEGCPYTRNQPVLQGTVRVPLLPGVQPPAFLSRCCIAGRAAQLVPRAHGQPCGHAGCLPATVAPLCTGITVVGKPTAAKLDHAVAEPQRASHHRRVPMAALFRQGTMVQSVLNKHGGDATHGLVPAGSESGRAALAQQSLSQCTTLSGQHGASLGAAVPTARKPDDLPGDNRAPARSARAGPAPQVCKQSMA